MKRYSILILSTFILIFQCATSQELPKPTHANTFYIMPLFNPIRSTTATEMYIRDEMDKMLSQIGQGNLYHQVGVAGIFDGYALGDQACRLAKEKGMHYGLIVGHQTHTNPAIYKTLNNDIRAFQWRMNGIDWMFSAAKNTGDALYPGDLRDSAVFTASRLCSAVRSKLIPDINSKASDILKLMTKYPNVISVVNGLVEQEFAMGGSRNDGYLSDYSPYAITEFREWLRHTSIYDNATGQYKGQGAQEAIVGSYISINGALRSQFYDDPTPNNSNGTGVSFNTFFGTTYTSWTLRYYDLDAFPDPIPMPIDVTLFDPSPTTGVGFTAGGFDAPRTRIIMNKYWKAWSWDVTDQGAYPVGNPTNPAFGFRQQMLKNYIKDVFDAYAKAGLPTEIMYPHQIPGEMVSDGRLRSGADPIWTSKLDISNNAGITRFGYIDPLKITQYAPSWGIFEWHPRPGSLPQAQELYNDATKSLNDYYKNSCHVLFPGWWRYGHDERFLLPDTRFADAIKDFLAPRKEQPYYRQEQTVPNYTPPVVTKVEVIAVDATTQLIRWGKEIWTDFPETWRMWSDLNNFELEESTDNITWKTIPATTAFSKVVTNRLPNTIYYYRVRANSKANVKGSWSQIASTPAKINFVADRMNIDPSNVDITNNISIQLQDNLNNNATINTFSAGGTYKRVDSFTSFATSFTNINQSITPSDVQLSLKGAVNRNVGDAAIVQYTPPAGATIDAISFDYVANYDSTIVAFQILDDKNQVIWQNDGTGLSSGYYGIHFPATTASFTICLKMKKISNLGAGFFAQMNGINVVYTNPNVLPLSSNSITTQVVGNGFATSSVPSNYLQADAVMQVNSASDIFAPTQLSNINFTNGLFTARTAGIDAYNNFRLPHAIDGTANPNIYFKIFCSDAINGFQFRWLKTGTTWVTKTLNLNKGWNTIELKNLADWINCTNITALRFDYGTSIGVTIKVDWIAISPQVYSGTEISLLNIENGTVNLPTYSNGVFGSYTITASYGTISNSITVNYSKFDQSIQFLPISAKIIGDADFNIGATVSSGLPLSYASSNPAVARINSAGIVRVVGVGTTAITASQVGDLLYNPAPSVVRNLRVTKGSIVTDNNELSNDEFEIYPNPTKDIVCIRTFNYPAKIEIYNASGLKVFSTSEFINEITLPTNKIGGEGLYFVNVNGVIRKLIILK